MRTEQFVPSSKTRRQSTFLVSALRARTHFGKLLRRVETDGGSLIIEKRGTPRAILLSIRDYVRLSAPEPEVLKLLGSEAKRNGTSKLTERQIDKIIRATRASNSKRRKSP